MLEAGVGPGLAARRAACHRPTTTTMTPPISITTLSMLMASRRKLTGVDSDTERAINAMRRNREP